MDWKHGFFGVSVRPVHFSPTFSHQKSNKKNQTLFSRLHNSNSQKHLLTKTKSWQKKIRRKCCSARWNIQKYFLKLNGIKIAGFPCRIGEFSKIVIIISLLSRRFFARFRVVVCVVFFLLFFDVLSRTIFPSTFSCTQRFCLQFKVVFSPCVYFTLTFPLRSISFFNIAKVYVYSEK